MAGGVDVYEVGEQVGLAARFGTEDDPFDPPRVIFRLLNPQGRTVELAYGVDSAVVRTGPGSYQVIVSATTPGRWRYRFVAYGGMTQAQHEGFFDVFDVSSE